MSRVYLRRNEDNECIRISEIDALGVWDFETVHLSDNLQSRLAPRLTTGRVLVLGMTVKGPLETPSLTTLPSGIQFA